MSLAWGDPRRADSPAGRQRPRFSAWSALSTLSLLAAFAVVLLVTLTDPQPTTYVVYVCDERGREGGVACNPPVERDLP